MPIQSSQSGAVLLLELDAPESLNALTIPDLLNLRQQLRAAQDDDTIRVIVIAGAGDKAFCTGANLKATFPPDQTFARGLLGSRGKEAEQGGYTRLIDISDLQLWKPVIAAINGYCLGGGLELALQCDLRIGSHSASFALPEVRVASVPAVGGVQYLLRAIPAAHAMKLALTGDRIDAEQALRIGLVSELYTPETLRTEALIIASRIAANGPLAVQMVKKLALETAHMAPTEFVAHSNIAWGALRDSADRIEGRRAFAEKRTAEFRGA
ncbi:enoyl-CoA hydratase/isomerase family protein [Cupriavidus basilensis]|uniref:enoyl-CoA hydratase/isomerase family protein n=1 Tax=Cupriavidus basilensis TaxID=68895 RepID=UPI0023E8A3E9|nr:enoyl-CoA hydratase-related protein [Cupriavidus basilensis]MDF3883024.1 enoyl-CoA hydratase-related protein [Cupriavidus basilensis]